MSFQNILGHTKEIDILMGSIQSGRVAHSFLFSGPDGVGKRLVAFEFAKALNCAGAGPDACGACADCHLMDSSTHPNLTEVWPVDKDDERDASGLIRIEQIREIQNSLRYRVERGKKVVIVDGADRLVPAAANAFLKTLEEPPADSVIILVSSKATELLPTILSRCQRLNFRPLPDDAVRGYLMEKKGLSQVEAGAVARLSGGSISRASAYIDEGAHQLRKEVIERLGRLKPEDVDEALKFAEELSKSDGLAEMLEFLKSWYRDLLVAFEGMPHLVLNSDMKAFMKEDGLESFSRLSSSFWAIEEARKAIMPPRYGNKQLTMEVLLLKLIGSRFS